MVESTPGQPTCSEVIDRWVRAFSGSFKFVGALAPVAQSSTVMLVLWGMCYWLYKHKTFIKVCVHSPTICCAELLFKLCGSRGLPGQQAAELKNNSALPCYGLYRRKLFFKV